MIEISLGLFLAPSIADLFSVFPTAIIWAMMLLVGIELTKFAKDIRPSKDLIPMAATLIVAMITNMAYGFLVGLAVHHLIRAVSRKKDHCTCNTIAVDPIHYQE